MLASASLITAEAQLLFDGTITLAWSSLLACPTSVGLGAAGGDARELAFEALPPSLKPAAPNCSEFSGQTCSRTMLRSTCMTLHAHLSVTALHAFRAMRRIGLAQGSECIHLKVSSVMMLSKEKPGHRCCSAVSGIGGAHSCDARAAVMIPPHLPPVILFSGKKTLQQQVITLTNAAGLTAEGQPKAWIEHLPTDLEAVHVDVDPPCSKGFNQSGKYVVFGKTNRQCRT